MIEISFSEDIEWMQWTADDFIGFILVFKPQ